MSGAWRAESIRPRQGSPCSTPTATGGRTSWYGHGRACSSCAGERRLSPGSGLEHLRDVVSVAVGDFDNDGLADLVVVTGEGPALFRNRKGRFERLPTRLPRGSFERALWFDYDHDYDLDLLLLGARSMLLRHRGAGSSTIARPTSRSRPATPSMALCSAWFLTPEPPTWS